MSITDAAAASCNAYQANGGNAAVITFPLKHACSHFNLSLTQKGMSFLLRVTGIHSLLTTGLSIELSVFKIVSSHQEQSVTFITLLGMPNIHGWVREWEIPSLPKEMKNSTKDSSSRSSPSVVF